MGKRIPIQALTRAVAQRQAEHDKTCQRIYSQYNHDKRNYGQLAASFNAGFIAGSDEGKEQRYLDARSVLPVFKSLSARVKGKWTNKQRREWDKVYTLLTGGKRAKRKSPRSR